jgi:hypothetical protein
MFGAESSATSIRECGTEAPVTLVEKCFDNPSTSAISRAFAISSDLAAQMRKLIAQIRLTFCGPHAMSTAGLFRLIDLADGAGPAAIALDPIGRSMHKEIALRLSTYATSGPIVGGTIVAHSYGTRKYGNWMESSRLSGGFMGRPRFCEMTCTWLTDSCGTMTR